MAEIELIIQDILLHELALPSDYGTVNSKIVPSVYVVAPNVSLGTTDKLQIGIQSINSDIISNYSYMQYIESSTGGDTIAVQNNEAIITEMIQLDISSRNSDARTRRHKIFMALNSFYSEQKQEENNCRIFNLPTSFQGSPSPEGGTTIYKYVITFHVQHLHRYSQVVSSNDYYDNFGAYVDIEEESTIFEFTIPST